MTLTHLPLPFSRGRDFIGGVNWLYRLIRQYAWSHRAPKFLRKNRVFILILWAVLIYGFTWTQTYREFPFFQKLDRDRFDLLFEHDVKFGKPVKARKHAEVVVVGINDSSLDRLGVAAMAADSSALEIMANDLYPWPRQVWAVLVERLIQAGARVVALDIVFSGEAEGDPALAAVIAKYPDRIVLAGQYANPTKDGDPNRVSFISTSTSLVGDAETSRLNGSCTLQMDVDGRVRRLNYRTSLYWEAPETIRANLRDWGADDDGTSVISFASLAVSKFQHKEPIYGHSQPIPFLGRPGTFEYYPMEEVLAALENRSGKSRYIKHPRYRGGRSFKNKIVFVGATAEILHDSHLTPLGEMPGVEVHAHIASSLLSGRTLRDASPEWGKAQAFVVTLLSLLIVFYLRTAFGQFLALVVLLSASAVTSQWLFSYHELILPVGASDFCLIFIGGFGVLFNFTVQELEKGMIRGVLDRYVSKNVAGLVIDRGDDFAEMLLGKKQKVAILFSDVRGFTSIFESSDAVALVGQLNQYFRVMVGLIMGQGGTLQKFIGDAIMAAWGDTHSLGHQEDALRAVRTALAMRPALVKLNEGWQHDPDRLQMRIGVGINHGDVVVGEIGSPERKEFTVIGDAVNVAARIESATKEYHEDILVGGSVEQLTREFFVYRCVDLAKLMGKRLPVEMFSILSDASVPAPPWLASYHEAIAHFRAQRWDQASALFLEVNDALDGQDFLCQMYLERISGFMENPPPADWDGTHIFTNK